jgi:hypothetical protein
VAVAVGSQFSGQIFIYLRSQFLTLPFGPVKAKEICRSYFSCSRYVASTFYKRCHGTETNGNFSFAIFVRHRPLGHNTDSVFHWEFPFSGFWIRFSCSASAFPRLSSFIYFSAVSATAFLGCENYFPIVFFLVKEVHYIRFFDSLWTARLFLTRQFPLVHLQCAPRRMTTYLRGLFLVFVAFAHLCECARCPAAGPCYIINTQYQSAQGCDPATLSSTAVYKADTCVTSGNYLWSTADPAVPTILFYSGNTACEGSVGQTDPFPADECKSEDRSPL